MIEIFTDGSYAVGHVWFLHSWEDTVAEILATWDVAVLGTGYVNAYGWGAFISSNDELMDFCSELLTWPNEGYAPYPGGI